MSNTLDMQHNHPQRGHPLGEMNFYSEPTTPPRTPQRSNRRSGPSTAGQMAQTDASKHKSRGKGRQRNNVSSPQMTKLERPVPQSVPTKSARAVSTPSSAAYAGSTFHASPAPSTLPIPSFLKDVSDSPSTSSLKAAKEETSSDDSLTPPMLKAVMAKSREESPLDLLFKADREEKARTRSSSGGVGQFQPPEGRSLPTPGSTTKYATPAASGPGIFDLELHDTANGGERYESPYQTSYKERILAARSSSAAPVKPRDAASKSDALKAYLFSGMVPPAPPGPGPFEAASGAQSQSLPTSGHKSSYQPPHTAGPAARHPHNAMLHDPSIVSGSPRVQMRGSTLRQEVPAPMTPDRRPQHASVPISPTPYRTHKTPLVPSQSQNQAPRINATPYATTDRGSDLKMMEDQIRRMLKLEDGGLHATPSTVGTSNPMFANDRAPSFHGVPGSGVYGS